MDIKLWNLQYKLIYSVIVAGKSATFTDKVMARLINGSNLPFETIRKIIEIDMLDESLRNCRTGNYGKLAKCLPELIKLEPGKCTLEELEAVHGVGPKTARFFLLWTRPGVRYAALDTHILKFLREMGVDAPKSTPPAGEKYRKFELLFLKFADSLEKTPRELDKEIWLKYSGRG